MLADASSGHQNLQFRQLDWFLALHPDGSPSVRDMMIEADPDIILGADIVYDPAIIPPLIATLFLGISAGKSTSPIPALLALTVRRPETFRHFLKAAGDVFVHHRITFPLTLVQKNNLLSPPSSRRRLGLKQGERVAVLSRRS